MGNATLLGFELIKKEWSAKSHSVGLPMAQKERGGERERQREEEGENLPWQQEHKSHRRNPDNDKLLIAQKNQRKTWEMKQVESVDMAMMERWDR